MIKKKFTLHKFLCFLLLLLCITLAVFFLRLYIRQLLLADYVPVPFAESTKELKNPYIGWYTLKGFYLSEDGVPDFSDLPSFESQPGLMLLEINLHAYQNQPIGEKGLAELKQILEAYKKSGSQLILRFVYDWDGKGEENEPKELSTILTHMEQTIPIVNDYKDFVYLLQGIFVGSYGEMHGTKFMGKEDMLTLFSTLDTLTDPSIYLSVRTPAQLRTILTASSPIHCPGLFNDGILGSESDTGTYGTLSSSEAAYTSPWIRKDELSFQNTLCATVPNGGEVILDNPLNDFPGCVDSLRTMHISYLNSAYDSTVLDKWKKSTCDAATDPLYQGTKGYDYIGQHMGYRYVIEDMTLSFQPLKKKELSFSLSLNNTGFSAAYRDFSWTVTLIAQDGSAYRIPLSLSSKSLQPGEAFTVLFQVPAKILEEGAYSLYVSCYDTRLDREILLATDATHTSYGYALGTLSCTKLHSFKELLSLLTGSVQKP